MDKKLGQSAQDWKHMYFVGITKQPVTDINLSEAQVGGLLSMVDVKPAIFTGAGLEPRYLINAKGTTPWAAMYVLLRAKDENALHQVASGQTQIHIPSVFIRGSCNSHINWPEELLQKHDLTLGEHSFFLLPFLVDKDLAVDKLAQSLKAPDGSLEIFGIYEFSDSEPEKLLIELASLADFIKTERIDALV